MLNYGTLTATLSILDRCLFGLGYKNSSSIFSLTIMSSMLVGIFSNFIFSYMLKSTRAYRKILGLCIYVFI
jgi:hypothetical protein